jgi:hypothetical protein
MWGSIPPAPGCPDSQKQTFRAAIRKGECPGGGEKHDCAGDPVSDCLFLRVSTEPVPAYIRMGFVKPRESTGSPDPSGYVLYRLSPVFPTATALQEKFPRVIIIEAIMVFLEIVI